MTPEGRKPSEINSIFAVTAIIGGIYLLSNLAFSRKVRKEIYERDVTCRVCGGVGHLESAHISHDKTKDNYNDPSNGRLLCLPDHLADHINREGRNGLSIANNRWAIATMINKLKGKSNQVDSD